MGGRPRSTSRARCRSRAVPIESYGVVIGAIGVSGATDADEDRELAEFGAQSLQAAIAARANGGGSDGAAYFPATAVDEKFRAGGLLLDTPTYKVDAGRREGPGEPNITSAPWTSCTS